MVRKLLVLMIVAILVLVGCAPAATPLPQSPPSYSVGGELQPVPFADEIQKALDLYAGDYTFSDMGGFTLNITRAENKLYVTGPGQAAQELLPLSTTRFFLPVGYEFYQFDFVPGADSDQTDRLVLNMYGMSLTGQRKQDGAQGLP